MAESLPGENDTCSLGLSTEPLRRLDNGGAFEGMAVPCDSISGEVAQAASKLARASCGRPAFTELHGVFGMAAAGLIFVAGRASPRKSCLRTDQL